MILNQVELGTQYYTRITGVPVAVRPIERVGNKFVVQRVDNGMILPTPRGPGALHDNPGPWGVPGGRDRVTPRRPPATPGKTNGHSVAPPPVSGIPAAPDAELRAIIEANTLATRKLVELIGQLAPSLSHPPKRRRGTGS
jgi:hypothetical protein